MTKRETERKRRAHWDWYERRAALLGPVHCPDCGSVDCATERETTAGCGAGVVEPESHGTRRG